jgi:hypothetical protein
MPAEFAGEDSTLAQVRRRSQSYLSYLFWIPLVLCLLWASNVIASLVEHWVAMLNGVRRTVGLTAPIVGPDYWILGGMAVLTLVAIAALAWAYAAYRAAWNRRLRAVWKTLPESSHLRIRPLRRGANLTELQQRDAYLRALLSCSQWSGHPLEQSDDLRQSYMKTAGAVLRSIEPDIAARAVTAGFVVGLNRNPMIDSLTIAVSAFELQLHVLTRLGKRPSPRTWVGLIKRTTASLFLNTYVSRDDALRLNLAIRKAALGFQVASESADHVAQAMHDIDWDEVLHGMNVPGFAAVTSFATMSMTVGAFGLRQIGAFIEHTANDLLQGVLAAGILYYHGMSLAADCLALDEEHRHSPEMTRTIGESMLVACAPAGRLLRDQVRGMRQFLRERRRLAFAAARDAAKQGVDKLRSASSSKWESVKETTGFFRRST